MNASKLWLLLTCLVASGIILIHAGSADPDDFRKMTAGVRKKCIAETQTTLEDVENTEYGHFPNDVRLKCYFKCVLEKFKLMDKDGTIKYNMIKKIIPDVYREVADEMIDSCTDSSKIDKCQKSFNFMRCMFEVNPIAFIAP
ncbi:general odorant-binding protein 99a-like [Osmia bicornis bicornis]|uniref:general odorant-binding protein 99a-like n=1 Tax=Osmia bicornis bicornis TaxID=1437191 RepID=UPI001EAE924A|nr:general odorant-binding protein 99a-like [Osmia bicornis bicornis]